MSACLKQDEDPDYKNCTDRNMALFLNGLINKFRGKKEGAQKAPESRITNNIILRKLKIALNLIDDDILSINVLSSSLTIQLVLKKVSCTIQVGKTWRQCFHRCHHHKQQDSL